MSEIRVLLLPEILAAAERIIADPSRNAVRISQEEALTFSVLALQQHRMILGAGLSYPTLPRDPPPAPLPPPLFGPMERTR